MTVRVAFPDHTYEGVAKHLEYKDVGPGIVAIVDHYLGWVNGYRPAAEKPAEPAPATVDYEPEWEKFELGDDPDDALPMAAKRLIIERKGEEGAIEWLKGKKADGIVSIRRFLISWYKENRGE